MNSKKTLLLIVCATLGLTTMAQRNIKPKMDALYTTGYYVTQRNDTVRGFIQTNPESELEFYQQFFFKTKEAGKARAINTQRAKAYGFDDRNFVQTVVEGKKVFYERLVTGRLRFYELKQKGRENGYDAIVSEFFIRDTQPESATAELRVPKKVSKKFYKKTLKPYMSEQPMIWSDLDKFEFNPDKIVKALAEFNSYYRHTAN
jgi:hypothetical protein